MPDYLAGIDQGIRGLRIGFDARYVYDVCDADTRRASSTTRARSSRDLGAKIVPSARCRPTP